MKRILGLLLILSLCCGLTSPVIAQGNAVPRKLDVLALSRSNLDNYTTKVGDPFYSRTVEDIVLNSQTVVPTGSVISGTVTDVKLPKRFPVREGKIFIALNQIQTPDGKVYDLQNQAIRGVVISPSSKNLHRRVIEAIPPRFAGYGTTIPLNRATDMNNGVIYAIGTGASAIAGAAVGFIAPGKYQTRLVSAANGFIDGTPIGPIRGFVAIGAPASIADGDGITLTLDRKTIEKLASQAGITIAKK